MKALNSSPASRPVRSSCGHRDATQRFRYSNRALSFNIVRACLRTLGVVTVDVERQTDRLMGFRKHRRKPPCRSGHSLCALIRFPGVRVIVQQSISSVNPIRENAAPTGWLLVGAIDKWGIDAYLHTHIVYIRTWGEKKTVQKGIYAYTIHISVCVHTHIFLRSGFFPPS